MMRCATSSGCSISETQCDTTPGKQGRLSPGRHIPVRPASAFADPYPDYALLFAWNHAEEIMAKVFQIEEMVGIDPASAREALRRLHKDGRITVKLGSDGVWTAQSDVLPAVLVLEAQKVPGVSPRDLYASVVAGAGFEPTTFGL